MRSGLLLIADTASQQHTMPHELQLAPSTPQAWTRADRFQAYGGARDSPTAQAGSAELQNRDTGAGLGQASTRPQPGL